MNRHHHWLSWPRLQPGPIPVACPLCDALQDSPRLREGQGAYCCECGELLFRNRPHSLSRTASFASAALIFMTVSHTFPVLTMRSGGLSQRLTLMEAARVLSQDGDMLLGAAVVLFTIIAPFGLMGALLYLTGPLLHGVALPGAIPMAKAFHRAEPWSMLEVFLLGLLVSLQKLGHLATLQYGVGLWALAGAVLCLAAAVGAIDRMELWDRLEITRAEDS